MSPMNPTIPACLVSVALFAPTTPGQVTVLTSEDMTASNADADCAISSTSATSDFGRWTAFASAASDLVAGDTNNAWDVFVRDRTAGTTVRVSVSSGGGQAAGDSG
ncbi:MAG: hypothetical protein K8E66_04220, partial [Phycisphaerales bacterium]|nr:hypothetical protein [Phycisphaerales bacterium]